MRKMKVTGILRAELGEERSLEKELQTGAWGPLRAVMKTNFHICTRHNSTRLKQRTTARSYEMHNSQNSSRNRIKMTRFL